MVRVLLENIDLFNTCLNIVLETLLNQACAGLWPARTWFLKIEPVRIVCMCVCVCVCPPLRLLITSGVM